MAALAILAGLLALVPSSPYRVSRDGSATVGSLSNGLSVSDKGLWGGNSVSPEEMAPSAPPMADYDTVGREGMPYPNPNTAGPSAAEVDQRIIKNGSLQLTVDSVADTVTRITQMATSRKGFVQTSSTSERTDGKHTGVITIRVPSADFESTMVAIKAYAKVVNNETASGQDVTEQFTDLQAQLRNAQAQETEYLRILTKATTVSDILQVQQQLGYIRGQIEQLQGRIKYLENATSLSTIETYLTEEASVQVPTKEFRPVTIIKQATQSLINLAQDLATAIIWLVIVGGGVLLPLGLLWLIARAIWRALRRGSAGSSASTVRGVTPPGKMR